MNWFGLGATQFDVLNSKADENILMSIEAWINLKLQIE